MTPDPPAKQGPLFSRKEAIFYLGLQDRKRPDQVLTRLMASGQLAWVQVTGDPRGDRRGIRAFHREDLDAYIESRRQKLLDPPWVKS